MRDIYLYSAYILLALLERRLHIFFLGSFENFRLVTLMTLSAILSCHFASRVHTKGHDKSRGSRRQNATLELFDFTFCLQIQHHVYIRTRSLLFIDTNQKIIRKPAGSFLSFITFITPALVHFFPICPTENFQVSRVNLFYHVT